MVKEFYTLSSHLIKALKNSYNCMEYLHDIILLNVYKRYLKAP